MKFTIVVALCVVCGQAFAQTQGQKAAAVVTESTYLCKVEEFIVKKGAAKSYKKCDGLLDGADRPIKNGDACKEHALAKGAQCVKLTKAAKMQVRVRFVEKFGANANINTWTCELDNQGGSACP